MIGLFIPIGDSVIMAISSVIRFIQLSIINSSGQRKDTGTMIKKTALIARAVWNADHIFPDYAG